MKNISLLLISLGLLAGCPGPEDHRHTFDLVIYGNNSAGIIAGIQARRDGLDVIVTGPDRHLGGLTAGGLGWTDSGNKDAVGGLSREFYRRVKAHYDKPETWKHQRPEDYSRYDPKSDAMWVFEPHIAETVFEEMAAEAGLEIHRDKWLDRGKGVTVRKNRITEITMLDGTAYRSRVFMDASYEGDLMAAAGVTYAVGREPNSRYGETLNGVQTRSAVSHQFDRDVSPYVVPDDPSSGLLPRLHDEGPGEEGSGDTKVQAYNFRMCLTDVEENRLPFPKPEGYDPRQYELLGRYLDKGWRGIWVKFDPAPNNKTDANNHGAFSTDNIGMNYDYPEAGYDRREEIVREHERYQKGLMWYLAYDPRVPEDVRERMSRWGLARDEFKDNGNWPHQIYVREARRMVGDFVMTEIHLRGKKPTGKSIGMGSYNMDSHHVQRYVDARGYARNEGDIQVDPGGPYLISYDAVVPGRKEVVNILVPVCLSSSHIAYGSIRMEPVFMILGQSAAVAAGIAVRQDIPVQDVDYDVLRPELIRLGQVLELERDQNPTKKPGK
jgi:hypothetical protein